MIFGWITSCSGSSALLVGPASACRPSSGYRQSLIVTRKGSVAFMFNLILALIAIISITVTIPKGRKYHD
jgi:hypothetical protein